MTPERRAQLDRYYLATAGGGGAPPAGIKPPTAEEERQYRAVNAPQSGLTSADRAGSVTGRTSRRSAPSTPSTSGAAQGTSAPTTRGSRGYQPPTAPASDQAVPARRPEGTRSSWSEFLHQAMAENAQGAPTEGLRIPFEQHPSGVFDRYQNVVAQGAPPGFGRPVPNLMPGQQPAPSQRGPVRMETGTTPAAPQFRSGPPPGVFPPRYQNLSPTLAPDSRTMTNFNGAMQRAQPMMGPQRPMQPSFDARPMPSVPTTDTRFVASDRSYTPPPSYRQPRSAEEVMAEMELMRGR